MWQNGLWHIHMAWQALPRLFVCHLIGTGTTQDLQQSFVGLMINAQHHMPYTTDFDCPTGIDTTPIYCFKACPIYIYIYIHIIQYSLNINIDVYRIPSSLYVPLRAPASPSPNGRSGRHNAPPQRTPPPELSRTCLDRRGPRHEKPCGPPIFSIRYNFITFPAMSLGCNP